MQFKKINKDLLAPCNHKEADTRMIVHAKHASLIGSKTITFVSSDTGVVVPAIAVYFVCLLLNEALTLVGH